MDYEYQIISLPLGSSRKTWTRPMSGGGSAGDYDWFLEDGATTVLMDLVRTGWEPMSTLGLLDGVVSIMLRKRLAVGGRAGH